MSATDLTGRPTLTVVVNPSAGRGRARKLLPDVRSALADRRPDLELVVQEATSFAHAQSLTESAVAHARSGDALAVMGGDGMAHLGLNACAETGIALGVIPAGTGNDFCRGVGIPHTTWDAVDGIIAGTTRRIDLARVHGELGGGAARGYVGSVVSTGYDAVVNRATNAITVPLGPLAYGYAALRELATFTPRHYRITVDGQVHELEAMLIAVGNAGYFGGGMHVLPNAEPDDGELDITIITKVSRLTLLRVLPEMYSGRFVRIPQVELLRASEVIVESTRPREQMFAMADGEEIGVPPLRITCVPGALSVFG